MSREPHDTTKPAPARHAPGPTGPASRTPVAIVGAGPVGVLAALLLARHGVRSVLLERHTDVYPLPRALVVDDEVRRILQAVGIGEAFAALARPGGGLRLLDARHRVMAEFRRAGHGPHGYPQTSMFEQPALERLLRDALARRPECAMRNGAEVTAIGPDTEGPVRVTYRDDDGEHHLWADAVLGCDGANGLTRDAIGAVWEDLRFEERWTVVDVRTRAAVRCWGGVDQVCDPDRPATFMRVGEDRYRWEFRLPDGEHLEGPDGRERLRELVAPWVVLSPADDFDVVRQTRYTFRARIADRWRRGRVFLLGDAAHLTPPFIGQGLCAGLRDAHNLSWKLALVLRRGADERLLDSYESERRPHARRLIRLAVATGWAMTGGQDGAAALRRTLVGALCRLPGLTAAVGRDLSPPLTPGPLVRRGRLTGTLCPQPEVTASGRRVRFDDLLGDSFAVLSAVPPTPALTAVAEALDAPLLTPHDDTLTAWLRAGRADAVLLRPDRVVLDTVPAGAGGFTDTARWAPLLCSTRVPAEPPPSAPLPRSTAR